MAVGPTELHENDVTGAGWLTNVLLPFESFTGRLGLWTEPVASERRTFSEESALR